MSNYNQSPLPFMGQKRRWSSEFRRALKNFDNCDTFIDLFGGSGLLSRMVKDERPDARVVYNDFDDYHVRINNIGRTNALLVDLREILADCEDGKVVRDPQRKKVLMRLRKEAQSGFVDYITLSSSLLFSMNYATSYEQFAKQTIYNNVRQTDYNADGYLDGLIIEKKDYRKLFYEWCVCDKVCFLVDPPYLSTESGTYTGYWRLHNYLDVLQTVKGTNYFYFTSNKSSIIELCDWLEKNYGAYNPFHGATRVDIVSRMNYNSVYTDIMLYKRKDVEFNLNVD